MKINRSRFLKVLLTMTVLFPLLAFGKSNQDAMPTGFVYLKNVAPSILQDIRYATHHNFVGHPIEGYGAKECILTRQAAEALKKVQAALLQSNLSLKVYDCYRPQRAVNAFIQWSQQPKHTEMKAEFYPNTAKSQLFPLGYLAKKSGHSRGSTVDITIVPVPTPQQANYHQGQSLVSCIAPYHQRYADNTINMGTGYDCMAALSHAYNPRVTMVAYQNRNLLRHVMQQYGFKPYDKEWWHFTLDNEPYPKTYFNFPIRPDRSA